MDIIISLFRALFLTILIESVAAWFFGLRKKQEITAVIFVNVITNPVLNCLLLINRQFSFLKENLALILFLEAMVVLAEWKLLRSLLKASNINKNRLLITALAMNFCSYIFGVLFFLFL